MILGIYDEILLCDYPSYILILIFYKGKLLANKQIVV